MELLPDKVTINSQALVATWNATVEAENAARFAEGARRDVAGLMVTVLVAHKMLTNPGHRSDLRKRDGDQEPATFEQWCELAHLPRSTVYRWLSLYDDDGRLLGAATAPTAPTAPPDATGATDESDAPAAQRVDVQYRKAVVSMERALARFKSAALGVWGPTTLPAHVSEFVRVAADAWRPIYDEEMADKSPPQAVEVLSPKIAPSAESFASVHADVHARR